MLPRAASYLHSLICMQRSRSGAMHGRGELFLPFVAIFFERYSLHCFGKEATFCLNHGTENCWEAAGFMFGREDEDVILTHTVCRLRCQSIVRHKRTSETCGDKIAVRQIVTASGMLYFLTPGKCKFISDSPAYFNAHPLLEFSDAQGLKQHK